MTRTKTLIVLVLATVLSSLACRGGGTDEPAVATPSFSSDRARAPLGSPVELTYKFTVAPDAKIDRDYSVFVHFLDSEGDLMWTDDHTPVPPTRQWKPGQTVSYSHTMFIPVYPYIGEASVRVGLYSPADGRRLALNGDEQGDKEYRVGSIVLAPQSENIFLIYRDGWNTAESAPDQPAVEWQWTKKSAGVSFRNPKKDVVFLIESDGRPDVFTPPQRVSIRVNDQIVQTFEMTDRNPVIRRIPMTAAQLGNEDMVDLKIEVDRSFVPAEIPAGRTGHGNDKRELGIRVYHLFVGPAQ